MCHSGSQLLKTDLCDWLSPEAEGTEFWEEEVGVLFLASKRENMLHKLTQSAVPGDTIRG